MDLTYIHSLVSFQVLGSPKEVEEHVAKVGQTYYTEVISRANDDPREFMKNNLQETILYPSNMVSKGDGGSNLVFDYKKEMNKSTNPITREQLYNENFNNKKAVSNINMMQRDAHTARDVLSTYGNKQHTQPEHEKKEGLRPEIMKGEMLEQKQENIIENEQQGRPEQANIIFNSGVFNNRNPLAQRRRF